jgi:3-oxoacyl-[acyl-carrier protein] reductase
MFSLEGQTALVTGASGGLGGAISRALHAQGATVALSGTREDALQALREELGDNAFVLPCNLSDAGAVEALVPHAISTMGSLSILIHNAGITRDGLAIRMKDEDWAEVLTVNLTAGFRLFRAALRGMMRERYGRLIAVGSVVGTTGNPGQANYAASKAGLVGMVKALAAEVASRNITVNCIAPGFIATVMTGALAEKQGEAILARIPMGRAGVPDEVAAAAVYLASREAGYVTGQTLHVNGGMAMP